MTLLRALWVGALCCAGVLAHPAERCPNAPTVELDQLKVHLAQGKTVTVEGVLVARSDCGPCPRGVVCEPCDTPNLVLRSHASDSGGAQVVFRLESYMPQLQPGRRYRLRVQPPASPGDPPSCTCVEPVASTTPPK